MYNVFRMMNQKYKKNIHTTKNPGWSTPLYMYMLFSGSVCTKRRGLLFQFWWRALVLGCSGYNSAWSNTSDTILFQITLREPHRLFNSVQFQICSKSHVVDCSNVPNLFQITRRGLFTCSNFVPNLTSWAPPTVLCSVPILFQISRRGPHRLFSVMFQKSDQPMCSCR